ncbi:MAG TPA: hypothetical protein VGH51_06945 [Candidatus Angelobacter sp.]
MENSRLAVLDVVALDEKGQPISDLKADDFTVLKADDFTVLEDGKPQTVRDFSFHHPGASSVPARQLAPNVIINAPQFSSNRCLNVILLDAIDTDFSSTPTLRTC